MVVESRRNLLKLRNNAFRYFAIEEVVKGGSQEKRDGIQECKILVRNWRRQVWTPCSTSIYGSSLRQGEKPLTLLAAKLAVCRLILRSSSSWTHLRPVHAWKRVKGIRVYCILLLVNSEEGVGQ